MATGALPPSTDVRGKSVVTVESRDAAPAALACVSRTDRLRIMTELFLGALGDRLGLPVN
jgi:hypothetical protein